MLRVLFDFCCGHVIRPTWRRHFRLPPLRQAQGRLFARNAKERAPHCVGDASEIKRPGPPASLSYYGADRNQGWASPPNK